MVLGDIGTLKVVGLEIGLSRAGLLSRKGFKGSTGVCQVRGNQGGKGWEGCCGIVNLLWCNGLGHETVVPVPGQQV